MPVIPPGLDVAVYDVITEPPLSPGAVNETVAVVEVTAVADPIVGAPGGFSFLPFLLKLTEVLPRRVLTNGIIKRS